MKEYILRDKNGENVMSWHILKAEQDFLHFQIQLSYSIFNGTFEKSISRNNMKRLIEILEQIYQSNLRNFYDFKIELSDSLCLYLNSVNGHLNIEMLFQESTYTYLSIKYVIDQSFLPEIIYKITNITTNSKTANMTDMLSEKQKSEWIAHNISPNNISFKKDNFEISDIIIHKSDNENLNYTWIEFQSTIQTKYYEIKRPVSIYLYELNNFKKALSELNKGSCDSIIFSPLGEFYMLEFTREKEDIHLKGVITDFLFPQSEACFECNISKNKVLQFFKELTKIE